MKDYLTIFINTNLHTKSFEHIMLFQTTKILGPYLPDKPHEGLIDKIYLIFYPRHTTLCHNANVSSFMTATHVTNQHIVTSPQTFSLSLHL